MNGFSMVIPKGWNRMLLCCTLFATILCLTLVSLVDRWGQPEVKRVSPKYSRDLVEGGTAQVKAEKRVSEQDLPENPVWEKEYERRVQKVREVCDKDEIAMMRRVWRVATNRRFGKKTDCRTKLCPIILDEEKVLFFCFIPKVASTRVKQFFLNISNIPVNSTMDQNNTFLHLYANTMLKRISPMYYPTTTMHRFFKIMFVRHPFDRLVSAFRSKAEAPRSEVPYFYDTYWDKVMRKLRDNGTVDENSRLTFPEFIWYLTHSLERDFDMHWAPYWSRCDPCLVDYDFIGKIETADHDFPYAFRKVGIDSPDYWWTKGNPGSRKQTLSYFAQVKEEDILKLYKIYRLDFELFDYSVDEFLHKNKILRH